MAANGFIAASGALSMLDYVTGRSTALDAEWAAKTSAGDLAPKVSYLMLLSTTVTDAQTAMSALVPLEVTGTGYARQAVTWSAAQVTAAPDNKRVLASSDLIQFGPFADAGGLAQPVAAVALVTRLTSPPATPQGLALMVWNLAAPVTTVQNQALQIASGSLKMELAVT
ncbi:hypothetical protein ABZ543_12995 [Streptomyces roseifaciens]